MAENRATSTRRYVNAACNRSGLTSSAVNAPVVSATSVESAVRTAHGRTIRQHGKRHVAGRDRDLVDAEKRRVAVREDRHQHRLLTGAHVRRRRGNRAMLDGRA